MIIKRSDIYEVEMDLTGVCNLSCYICTRNFIHSQHMVKKNIRKLNEITTQLDTFTNLKSFFLAGVVSEPTLYPYFIELIKYLNDRQIRYEIYSNANTHDTEWWKKLGEIVRQDCKMIFTICGSTQELHEKYRVGSNLNQIIENAAAFRQNNHKNDYVQYILFEYNKNDLYSGNMDFIFRKFSNHFIIHSEGVRLDDRKMILQPTDVRPPREIDIKIKYIFDKCKNDRTQIECKLEKWKKIYIDQFGDLYPCYTYAEYGCPPFDRNADNFDIDNVISSNLQTCFLCSKNTDKLIKEFGLDFIC